MISFLCEHYGYTDTKLDGTHSTTHRLCSVPPSRVWSLTGRNIVMWHYTGSGRSKACLSVVGRVLNNMGVIIYSFNLSILPKMSYGMLECDIVILQNYMLTIL